MNPIQLTEATGAAVAAGAVNALSGGGTLLTFPVLLGLGMTSRMANATSTLALWPGIISSMWGYRREVQGAGLWVWLLGVPSVIGGLFGSWVLLHTTNGQFDRIAPFLVLTATLLFMSHGIIARRLRAAAAPAAVSGTVSGTEAQPQEVIPRGRLALYLFFQLGVAIYGGYFGAGIGILMLASLGMMGLTNIHRMNGFKNWGGFCTNGVAIFVFATHGLIDWHTGLVMASGSIVGGYCGARAARRVGQVAVRRIIVGVGLIATLSLLFRSY